VSNELIIKEKSYPVEKFFQSETVDSVLGQLEEEAKNFVGDPTTAQGRKEIISFARKFSSTKAMIEKAGKSYVADLKALPKLIDAERKKIKEKCDALRDEVRRPVTEWESIRKEVDGLIIRLNGLHNESVADNSCQLAERVEKLLVYDVSGIVEDKKEEFTAALESATDRLVGLLFEKVNTENEKEELERLRREEEARVAKEKQQAAIKEAEERAKREAEEKARAEKLEAQLAKERAEREAQEARERAERIKSEAKEREKAVAAAAKKKAEDEAKERERLRQEEVQREKDLAAKRAKDEANRQQKHSDIFEALNELGLDNKSANILINGISQGLIPHVRIDY
jgi:hypothetical protein